MSISHSADKSGLAVGCSRETRIKNEHVRGMVANSPMMDTLMENAKMPLAIQTSAMKRAVSEG
jgi:hypothetical protein